MYFHVTDDEGITSLNPSRGDYARLLKDFLQDDGAIGEISMSHTESGWTLDVYPSGLVRLLKHPDAPSLEAGPFTYDDVLALWDKLAAGDLPAILKHTWKEAIRD